MSLFGKKIAEYVRFVRVGLILILIMGVVRFLVGISGVPYERATHLVSLTILTALLLVIYGQRAAATGFGTYRHLLPTAFALSVSMYGFIILAILTEGLTGLPGYFHVHSLHAMAQNPSVPTWITQAIPTFMNVPTHIGGQVVAMFLFGFLGWGLASLAFLASRYLGFLRNAFLLLAGLAVVRILLGAASVPREIGTWISSLTLLTMGLSIYYGYIAPSAGFDRYGQVILNTLFIAIVFNLLVISGIVITSSLAIPNYFEAAGVPIIRHVAAHAIGSLIETVPLSILAAVAFSAGKRKVNFGRVSAA